MRDYLLELEELNIGEAFKEIRQNKGLTQSDVTPPHSTQSMISQIENDNRRSYFTTFLYILHRINMSVDEFMYIINDYQLTSKAKLRQEIRIANHNFNIDDLKKAYKKCEEYIANEHDVDIIVQMNKILTSICVLERDYDQAIIHSLDTWAYLQSLDEWYFEELALFLSIMASLPRDRVEKTSQYALKRIKLYTDLYPDSEIEHKYLSNLAELYLREKNYEKALEYSTEAIDLCLRTNKFLVLGDTYIKNGVSLIKLGKVDEGYNYIDDGFEMHRLIKKDQLANHWLEELDKLHNIKYPR